MTRNAVRTTRMFCCLATLALVHVFWPAEAGQPTTMDPKVLDTFVARNIGPANMSGRIVQITGVESDTKTVYVAAASGGLWKTTDGGNTWAPMFDNQTSICIGDVAVSKSNPNIIWVGTGEHNIRNSVAWGDGVYKSTDGGKTWQHMGLKDSHTIGRIAIHPTNPDIVYVGVMGHTWGANKERGIFKTTDGGKNWVVSKFIDEDTGFVDLKMDPSDPDTLYAAAYKARRDGFSGSDNPSVFFLGAKAGLYKTSDGGKNWDQLTVALPTSQYGRCGIDIYRKDPNVVYAVIQTEKTPVGEVNQGGAVNGKGGPEMGGVFRSDDKGKTWKHLNTICPRPFYYGQIRVDPNDDSRIYVLGVSTAISNDGGKTFGGKGKGGVDDQGGGGGGLEADDQAKKDDQKKDDQKKDDPKKDEPQKKGGKGGGGGGKGGGLHSDHHALWVNPNDSNEVWTGTDGGFGISKNKGASYQVLRMAALGQFYGISVDMSRPYYVYGGLQDNGSHGGPSATYDSVGIRQNLWFSIGGGDGFHTACDPTDPNTVYSESQYGAFGRVNVAGKGGKGGKGKELDGGLVAFREQQGDQKKDDQKKDDQKKDDQKKDEPKKGEPQKKGGGMGGGKAGRFPGPNNRWNWSSPLVLSPHDPKTVYYGSQYLYMSNDKGTTFKQISPDLTYAPKDTKIKNWRHTLFTINESPKKKGVIWTGGDDGCVSVTMDGGQNWKQVTLPGIPKEGCVSRVEPSAHDHKTCYVSFTRYRNDDRAPYVFKTTDGGETWTNISSNLPTGGSVHVVIESSKNKDLLFCGTEFGLFVTMDGGKAWHQMKGGLPTVSVHDIVIHPRDRDLVIGTHGRSIYVIDDISPLENMTAAVQAKAAHLFEVRPTVAFKPTKSAAPKSNEFVGQNPPYGAIIRYQLKSPQPKGSIAILDMDSGKQLTKFATADKAGLHQVVWNLRADGEKEATVKPGDYLAVMQMGDQKQYRMLRVDPE